MGCEQIEANDRYAFYRMQKEKGDQDKFIQNEGLLAFHVHAGACKLEFESQGKQENHALKEGEAFIMTPGGSYRIRTGSFVVAFMGYADVDKEKPIIEIYDNGKTKEEIPLPALKIVREPKKVIKPWGHELWILWTKDHYVLKQIGMVSGKRSSMQVHRRKQEVNYLMSGAADVIIGFQLDADLSEEEMNRIAKDVDFDKYKQTKGPGDSWALKPGNVHRIISTKDYIAYEMSTPELDDVIRLKDDTGRASGRIDKEHQ